MHRSFKILGIVGLIAVAICIFSVMAIVSFAIGTGDYAIIFGNDSVPLTGGYSLSRVDKNSTTCITRDGGTVVAPLNFDHDHHIVDIAISDIWIIFSAEDPSRTMTYYLLNTKTRKLTSSADQNQIVSEWQAQNPGIQMPEMTKANSLLGGLLW